MITFIVPARAGSQRLKNKNIKELNGKPLIFYTLESLLDHELISRVIFTSDSEEYCDLVSREYGNKVTIEIRPYKTATNSTKVVDEVERLLENRSEYFDSEWFGLALPTAPLRDHNIVEDALRFFKKTKYPLFSCNVYDFPIQFAFRMVEEQKQNWSPVLESSPMITGNTRSQDIEKLYRPNGALYINSKSNFLKSKILYKNANAFEITSEASMDVDTELDFRIVEQIIKSKL
jgi:CMP-N-acetylneuraminic acid synthetase